MSEITYIFIYMYFYIFIYMHIFTQPLCYREDVTQNLGIPTAAPPH